MNISNLNNINFNGIHIDSSVMANIYGKSRLFIPIPHNHDLYEIREARCRDYKDTDVFVKADGTVYVTNYKTGDTIHFTQAQPLFYRYYLALVNADILEEKAKDV